MNEQEARGLLLSIIMIAFGVGLAVGSRSLGRRK